MDSALGRVASLVNGTLVTGVPNPCCPLDISTILPTDTGGQDVRSKESDKSDLSSNGQLAGTR